MGVSIQQGLTASSGAIEVSTSQPTSDVAEVAFTGFSDHEVVKFGGAFTHNSASAIGYTIQGRVSGGSWRSITQFVSPADATSSMAFEVTIYGFNQTTGKLGVGSVQSNTTVLDDSDAANVFTGTAQAPLVMMGYASFSEVWDEVKIVAASGTPIEGSTADQRGRFWAVGF